MLRGAAFRLRVVDDRMSVGHTNGAIIVREHRSRHEDIAVMLALGVNSEGHADLDDRSRLRGALEQDGLVRRALMTNRTHLRPCCNHAIVSHHPEVKVFPKRLPLLGLECDAELRTNAS